MLSTVSYCLVSQKLLNCEFHLTRPIGNEQSKMVTTMKLGDQNPRLVRKVSRRLLLQLIGLSPVSIDVYPLLAVQKPEMKEPDVIR